MPRKIKKENHFFLVKISFLILVISLTFINLTGYFKRDLNDIPVLKKQVLGEKNDISQAEKKIEYWEQFLAVNPNYLPGFLELAKAYKENGQEEKAKTVLEKALAINPNSKEIVELLSKI